MGNRNCPVCGERRARIIKNIKMKVPRDYRLPDSYDVAACERCGHVYADTSASKEDYDWYYAHCNFYGDDSKDDNCARYEMTEDLLAEYFDKSSALLEMGAGNGRFSAALTRHGYRNVTATDPSKESVSRLQKEGIPAFVANIYDEVLPQEALKYDGIFLFEVAEHLLFPGKGAGHAVKMLKPDGVFIISVPDYSRIGDDPTCIPNYFNLEHINYFSETSLDFLMAAQGMRRVGQRRYGADLIQAYRKEEAVLPPEKDTATEAAIRKYLERQEKRSARTAEAIEAIRAKGEEVVIWGTGSYVMNLFAETNLSKCRILGFVDNNKLKQGRDMFGYRIYPPKYLKDASCKVLICSMLHAGQIKEQLEQMQTGNEIAVL